MFCFGWIWMGSQIKSHISCISQTQEDEDEVVLSDKEEVTLEVIEVRVGQDLKADSEVDSLIEEDSREESLTRVLPLRDPEYLVKLKIKIKTDAIIVIREVTLQRSAQRKARARPQNPLRERNSRTIHTLIVVQRSLSWLWPQPYPRPMRMLWLP